MSLNVKCNVHFFGCLWVSVALNTESISTELSIDKRKIIDSLLVANDAI
jgi:hypothetical protein